MKPQVRELNEYLIKCHVESGKPLPEITEKEIKAIKRAARDHRYNCSQKGRERKRRFLQTEKGRESNRQSQQKYDRSDKGRTRHQEYYQNHRYDCIYRSSLWRLKKKFPHLFTPEALAEQDRKREALHVKLKEEGFDFTQSLLEYC